MREDFLHFLWQFRRFDQSGLKTTEGQPIAILHVGHPNRHAGPDFFNARLNINGTEWGGTVEMHLRASDWYKHKHQADSAYDNVILHVVFEADEAVLRANGEPIPTLVMNGRIPPDLQRQYEQLLHETAWIPCASTFGKMPEFIRLNWLDRVLVERLEAKTAQIKAVFEDCGKHWGEAFYRIVLRSFGLRQNTEPCEMLGRSLPFSVLAKHADQPIQVEALLFGQAGFLSDLPKDAEDYEQQLAKEYRYLAHKYNLKPLHPSVWKFLRMRPANFPTIRLAQFAALISQNALHPDKFLDIQSPKALENLLNVSVSDYWKAHYIFGKKSTKREKRLGKTFIQLLTINTIVPFLFLYGKIRNQPDHCDRALELLEKLPPEQNSIIEQWETHGQRARNAAHTQALLQLKANYCDQKRCLECAVGHLILKG